MWRCGSGLIEVTPSFSAGLPITCPRPVTLHNSFFVTLWLIKLHKADFIFYPGWREANSWGQRLIRKVFTLLPAERSFPIHFHMTTSLFPTAITARLQIRALKDLVFQSQDVDTLLGRDGGSLPKWLTSSIITDSQTTDSIQAQVWSLSRRLWFVLFTLWLSVPFWNEVMPMLQKSLELSGTPWCFIVQVKCKSLSVMKVLCLSPHLLHRNK